MIDYYAGPGIEIMSGDIIVHEHHYVFILQPSSFQQLISMAHISLQTPKTQLFSFPNIISKFAISSWIESKNP